MDSTLEAIIELDHELNVNLVNYSAETMFFCPSNHFQGRNFSEFLTKESINTLSNHIKQLDKMPLGKRHLVIENGLDAIRIDGTELHVDATLSEFFMGSDNYYTLILKDILDKDKSSEPNPNIEYQRPAFNDKLRDSYCNDEIL